MLVGENVDHDFRGQAQGAKVDGGEGALRVAGEAQPHHVASEAVRAAAMSSAKRVPHEGICKVQAVRWCDASGEDALKVLGNENARCALFVVGMSAVHEVDHLFGLLNGESGCVCIICTE